MIVWSELLIYPFEIIDITKMKTWFIFKSYKTINFSKVNELNLSLEKAISLMISDLALFFLCVSFLPGDKTFKNF